MSRIHETIYSKLKSLGWLQLGGHWKLSAGAGMMPLSIERIGNNEISVCHYFEQNGDLMRDPEMTIAFNHDLASAEALTFQQDSLGLYQEIYGTNELGEKTFRPKLKADLNKFLNQWLTNIKSQGYVLEQ